MSQDLKNRNEAVRRRGRRLAQEQVRRPREESRADAAARQESRDRTRVSSLRADRPPEQGGTRPREAADSRQRRERRKPRTWVERLGALYLAAEHETTRVRCRWRRLMRERRAHNFP